jgi:hypothetical protein
VRALPPSKSRSCLTSKVRLHSLLRPSTRLALFETSGCDKVPTMKLTARLMFAFLVINLAALTPVVPGEPAPVAQQKHSCCADMNVSGGVRCPINSGSTAPSSAMCCTGPSACLFLYFGNTNLFAAQTHVISAISLNNIRATARSQRPPVPPPRIAFS